MTTNLDPPTNRNRRRWRVFSAIILLLGSLVVVLTWDLILAPYVFNGTICWDKVTGEEGHWSPGSDQCGPCDQAIHEVDRILLRDYERVDPHGSRTEPFPGERLSCVLTPS